MRFLQEVSMLYDAKEPKLQQCLSFHGNNMV